MGVHTPLKLLIHRKRSPFPLKGRHTLSVTYGATSPEVRGFTLTPLRYLSREGILYYARVPTFVESVLVA